MEKSRTEKIITSYVRFLEYGLGVLVMLYTSLTFLQVVVRYMSNLPLFWIEELARYLLILTTVTGGTLAFHADIHPRVGLLFDRIPYKSRMRWELVVRVVIVFFLLILIIAGFRWAKSNEAFTSPGLEISFFWPQLALPVGGLSMLIILVLDSFVVLTKKRSLLLKEKTEEEVL